MAGQIIKRGEKTWLVRIFLGRDAKGKRKYLNKTIQGPKKDAQTFLTGKLRERDLGIAIETSYQTVNEFLDFWQKTIKARVAEQTFDSYEIQVRLYIRPQIGEIRLVKLTTQDVQKISFEMEKRGLSSRTIRYTFTILSMALKKAVELSVINRNPCNFVELPRKVKKEMKCLNPEQASKFLKAAKNNRHFALFYLAIETGLRPGEYLGLQWKDIELEEQVLRVQRVAIESKKGGYRFDKPKTAKSRRSVPFSKRLADALKRHRRDQLEERLKSGAGYENLDLVFATHIGTPHQKKNIRVRYFKPLVKKAGLPTIRLYDLRHTMATLLLVAGVNPKIVSERLGHASVVLTLDTYSHVLPTMQEDATAKLDMMLKTG